MDRNKYIAIGVATLILSGGGYYGYDYYKDKKTVKNQEENDQKQNTEETKKEENNNNNNNTNNNNTQNTETKTNIEISSPVDGAELVGSNRTIKGRSINTGGKIFYVVSGSESGALASGTIDVSDSGSYAQFSKEISYDKKPTVDETGYLYVYIMKNGTRIDITKIGVKF